MLGTGILELFKNNTFYQFHANLLREPDSVKALYSFIFNVDKQRNLTTDEALVAEDLNLLWLSLSHNQVTELLDIVISKRDKLLEALDMRLFFGGISFSTSRKYLPISLTAGLLNYLCVIPASNFIASKLSARSSSMLFMIPSVFLSLGFNIIYFRYVAALHTIGSTTPLHRAAIAHDVAKFQQLVQRGADPTRMDNEWKNAFDLLAEHSELRNYYASTITQLPVIHPYGFLELAEDWFSVVQAKTKLVAQYLDILKQRYVSPLIRFETINTAGMRPAQALLQMVKVGNIAATQQMLQQLAAAKIELSVAVQTELFAHADSVAMLQILLTNGLEFRPYLFELYTEKQAIEESGMGAAVFQRKIEIMHKLLPHWNEELVEKVDFDDIFCPITYTKQSNPVRIDNNPNDPNRFELTALLNWQAQKKNLINPATKIPFELENIVFDLATYKIFEEKISSLEVQQATVEAVEKPVEARKVTVDLAVDIGKNIRAVATKILSSQFTISLYSALVHYLLPSRIATLLAKHNSLICIIYSTSQFSRIKKDLVNPLQNNTFLASFNESMIKNHVFINVLQSIPNANTLSAPVKAMFFERLNLFYLLSAMHVFSTIVNMKAPGYADATTHKFIATKPENFLQGTGPVISYWKDVVAARQSQGQQISEETSVVYNSPGLF